jgi:hypothetical protein
MKTDLLVVDTDVVLAGLQLLHPST